MSNENGMKKGLADLKKAYLERNPNADKDILRKAGEKFRRMANTLNSVPDYILESGFDWCVDSLATYYAETQANPSGKNTANRERAEETRRIHHNGRWV